MIRKQEYLSQTQIMEDLRPNTVVAINSITGFQACLTLAQSALLHNIVGAQLIDEIKAVVALAQIQNYTARLTCDFLQRRMKLKAGVVNQRSKHITGYILSMDPYQNRIVCFDFTHNHSEVNVTVYNVFISNRAELSIDCRQIRFHYASH